MKDKIGKMVDYIMKNGCGSYTRDWIERNKKQGNTYQKHADICEEPIV